LRACSPASPLSAIWQRKSAKHRRARPCHPRTGYCLVEVTIQ
jgi:hypothetical protein